MKKVKKITIILLIMLMFISNISYFSSVLGKTEGSLEAIKTDGKATGSSARTSNVREF